MQLPKAIANCEAIARLQSNRPLCLSQKYEKNKITGYVSRRAFIHSYPGVSQYVSSRNHTPALASMSLQRISFTSSCNPNNLKLPKAIAIAEGNCQLRSNCAIAKQSAVMSLSKIREKKNHGVCLPEGFNSYPCLQVCLSNELVRHSPSHLRKTFLFTT